MSEWQQMPAEGFRKWMLAEGRRSPAIDELAEHVRARRNLPPPTTRRALRNPGGIAFVKFAVLRALRVQREWQRECEEMWRRAVEAADA